MKQRSSIFFLIYCNQTLVELKINVPTTLVTRIRIQIWVEYIGRRSLEHVRPTKIQISLGICAIWSES